MEAAFRELYSFQNFHPVRHDRSRDPRLHELELAAEKGYVALETLIQELGLKAEVGVLDQLRGKSVPQQKVYSASDLGRLLSQLEEEANPLIAELKEIIERKASLTEELNSRSVVLAALRLLSDVGVDLSSLQKLKKLYATLVITSPKDLPEIRRSMQEAAVLDFTLTRSQSAVLVVCSIKAAERVDRTLKGFGVKPFIIPSGLPQVPSEAYRVVERELEELKSLLSTVETRLSRFIETEQSRLISLRDGYRTIKDALRSLGGGGELRRFAVIRGYVPADATQLFVKRVGERYPVFVSEPSVSHERGHQEEAEQPPSLLKNRGIQKPFENITMIQGTPGYLEVDPTPWVSIFFPLFYGIMFADLGQGLILLGFGLFVMKRTSGNLRLWGMLLSILGASSAVVGGLLGEAFGFKVGEYIGSPGLFHLVEEHAGTKQFNIAEVQRLLTFTILLGVLHLIVGYVLSVVKLIKNGELSEALASRLPTLAMYLFGILFALAFFGAGGDMSRITSATNPVPLIGLPTNVVGTAGIGGAISTIIILMFGRFVIGLAGKGRRVGIVAAMGYGLLEVLENIIHFLSNSISYARLTILLIIHTALLLLVNSAWEAIGPSSLPILIIGNIGIMLLEGMLVFIQALRLHLYEFFEKFFEGEGQPFRKIAQETPYARIRLE